MGWINRLPRAEEMSRVRRFRMSVGEDGLVYSQAYRMLEMLCFRLLFLGKK